MGSFKFGLDLNVLVEFINENAPDRQIDRQLDRQIVDRQIVDRQIVDRQIDRQLDDRQIYSFVEGQISNALLKVKSLKKEQEQIVLILPSIKKSVLKIFYLQIKIRIRFVKANSLNMHFMAK